MPPLLAFVVSAVVTHGAGDSPRLPEYPHVRAGDARIARLIADTARRSPTFARLHAALQRTDVILFIEPSATLPRTLHGRLRFISATPLARYLRAEVRADLSRAEMIEAIAHEMQHALEIAEAAGVVDASTLDGLYRRIGLPTGAVGHYDTDVAYRVGARVRNEAV